jgi:hypothetical protein
VGEAPVTPVSTLDSSFQTFPTNRAITCTIKHPEWYEPQVSMDKKVKVPRKKVLVSEDSDAFKNEENVDSSYVSSHVTEHMDAHEALEPETTKESFPDK